MITRVVHGIWRWCPLHRMIEKVELSAGFRKGFPMIDGDYGAGADRHGSTSRGESTLLPMLIAGLVAVVVGLTAVALFA